MSEMMLSSFSGHVSLIRHKFAYSQVCSTSVSKHQCVLLRFFGQNVAKLQPKCKPCKLYMLKTRGVICLANTEISKQLSRQNRKRDHIKTATFPLSFIFVCFQCVLKTPAPGIGRGEVSCEEVRFARRLFYGCKSRVVVSGLGCVFKWGRHSIIS